MFKSISQLFYQKTRGWLVLVLLLAIVSKLFVLPTFESWIGMSENMVSLDAMNLYSPDEIYSILTEWGDDGRNQQVILHLSWDFIFPTLYFFFLGFLFAWLGKKAFKKESRLRDITLLSFVAFIDLLENLSLIGLIITFPEQIVFLAIIKTVLTGIKYLVFGPAICISLIISVTGFIKFQVAKQERTE